jgi:hypothetical protein
MTELTPAELADIEARFENFDADGTATVYDLPEDEGDLPPDVVLTRALARRELLLRQAEQVMIEAVDRVRHDGLSWHKVGIALGTTGEAARQRYSVRRAKRNHDSKASA